MKIIIEEHEPLTLGALSVGAVFAHHGTATDSKHVDLGEHGLCIKIPAEPAGHNTYSIVGRHTYHTPPSRRVLVYDATLTVKLVHRGWK